MELDELKNIWKKKDADFKPKGEAELASMLKGNSKSIVDKLIRSVSFELVFTLISGVVLLISVMKLPGGFVKWSLLSILVVFVGYIVYYIKKLSLLRKFNRKEDNIKANLTNLITTLTSYLHFYKRSYTILYPVYFVVVLLLLAIERGFEQFTQSLFNWRSLLNLTLVGIAFYLCSTWVVDWFLKKLYGNHLDKLKALLNDIQASEKLEA